MSKKSETIFLGIKSMGTTHLLIRYEFSTNGLKHNPLQEIKRF
jgi:hypothetical protein